MTELSRMTISYDPKPDRSRMHPLYRDRLERLENETPEQRAMRSSFHVHYEPDELNAAAEVLEREARHLRVHAKQGGFYLGVGTPRCDAYSAMMKYLKSVKRARKIEKKVRKQEKQHDLEKRKTEDR